MPPVGFEPAVSSGERPQTYALDRAVTGTGIEWFGWLEFRLGHCCPARNRSIFLFVIRIRCATTKPNCTVVTPHYTRSCTRAVHLKSVHDEKKYGRSHVVTRVCSSPLGCHSHRPLVLLLKASLLAPRRMPGLV